MKLLFIKRLYGKNKWKLVVKKRITKVVLYLFQHNEFVTQRHCKHRYVGIQRLVKEDHWRPNSFFNHEFILIFKVYPSFSDWIWVTTKYLVFQNDYFKVCKSYNYIQWHQTIWQLQWFITFYSLIFADVSTLQDIDLSNNFLSSVPTSLTGLSSLKRLSLSANLIQVWLIQKYNS